jgi:Domain of unknown function (DUF1877)
MSMTMSLAALSDDELDGVLTDPSKAFDLVFAEYALDAANDDELAYLDKAWHGIHYLLTGTAWEGEAPWNTLLAGGTEVPDSDEEWGYGPPRCVSAADTARFAQALAATTDDELAARFDPGDMGAKGIYPEIWDRPPSEDDTLGYLMEYVAVLRKFVADVTARNKGLLIALV